jgi:hypothetical protein
VGIRIAAGGSILSAYNVLITVIFLLTVAGFQFLFFGMVASLIVRTGQRRGITLAPETVYPDEDAT